MDTDDSESHTPSSDDLVKKAVRRHSKHLVVLGDHLQFDLGDVIAG